MGKEQWISEQLRDSSRQAFCRKMGSKVSQQGAGNRGQGWLEG